ncbi:MAG TPA: TQO small subunit DoxD [Candidatus Limnocylindrales bacterium]|jgi:thiosulfate dehydrogenase [quinone] large subunit
MPRDRTPSLHAALLPLRFFVGGTFLFAGVDKLLDPAFLQVAGPGSIGEQLTTYSQISPLAPLIRAVALPAPLLIGVIVAGLEIAAGLGALTGLAYRLSAVVGALLAGTFFLTASWSIRPYYLGPDLPYMVGWITLAIAGDGGRYVIGSGIERAFSLAPPPADEAVTTVDRTRRGLLQLIVLAAGSLSVAGITGMLSALGPAFGSEPVPSSPIANGSGSPSGGPGASRAPGVIATVAAVRAARSTVFTDPTTGDPAVLVALPDGSIVAFDAVCTHAGCTVNFDRLSGHLLCPCHGAIFDPAHGARVLDGPTDQPLPSLPLQIDQATGTIRLAG